MGYKGITTADQLTRQGKWYEASSSLLLHAAVVAMGNTVQDVEDAAAALLGDHPQALTVGPVAVDNNKAAREATQIGKLLAVRNLVPGGAGGAQASARAARGVQAGREGDPTSRNPTTCF